MSTDPERVAQLRAETGGRVVSRDDPGYENARRVWNGMIDRRPALVVQAESTADVVATIGYARASGLPLAIRGGGHNVAGHGTVDHGVVLDMGRLAAVEVDPSTSLVRVGAGATLKDVDAATEPFGLAVPIGVVSGTGIAGLTLGGGVGWLTRRHGLTIDNLVSADVVLATGEQVRASETEHPDLFWGLRGGGGNFGVVTAFTFRAHPLAPDAFVGSLVYERAHWPEALRAWRAWTADAPDEMTTLLTLTVPPPDWELGDQVLLFLGFAWAGTDRAAGEAVIGRLQAACPPDVALLDPTRWVTFQSTFDSAMPPGVRAYWRNAWFASLEDGAIDALDAGCAAQALVGTAADLHHMGGTFARVREEATAFPDRSAAFWLNLYGFWSDPADDPARIAWVKDVSDSLRPWAMTTRYVNFLGHEDDPTLRRASTVYGPDKLARLTALKRRYDPDNLFRINHNIPPGAP